jgi:outer membrane immunogenic protein
MRWLSLAAPALLLASAASAADLPRPYYNYNPSPAPALSAYGWTGPYLGGNLGYEWGTTSNNPTRPSGFAGGVQGGYNWQTGQFVFGGEADIQVSGANDLVTPWKFSNPWFGTLRGRGGIAFSNFLVYGTLGFAVGELEAQTVGLVSENHASVGWTAGAGVEMGLTQNWSAKAEYLYVDLSSNNFALTGVSNGLTANLLRLGVNYHF